MRVARAHRGPAAWGHGGIINLILPGVAELFDHSLIVVDVKDAPVALVLDKKAHGCPEPGAHPRFVVRKPCMCPTRFQTCIMVCTMGLGSPLFPCMPHAKSVMLLTLCCCAGGEQGSRDAVLQEICGVSSAC